MYTLILSLPVAPPPCPPNTHTNTHTHPIPLGSDGTAAPQAGGSEQACRDSYLGLLAGHQGISSSSLPSCSAIVTVHRPLCVSVPSHVKVAHLKDSPSVDYPRPPPLSPCSLTNGSGSCLSLISCVILEGVSWEILTSPQSKLLCVGVSPYSYRVPIRCIPV